VGVDDDLVHDHVDAQVLGDVVDEVQQQPTATNENTSATVTASRGTKGSTP
jgi:hypothetical protein